MNKLVIILIFATILIIYKPWIINSEIIASDFPYFFQEFISSNSIVPPAWSPFHGNGFGGRILVYSLDSYMYLTQSISRILNIEWPIVYKIFWYFSYLFLAILSSFKLSSFILGKNKEIALICSLIYVTNTYILMVVSGGQMGIALAYSIIPFCILYLLKLFEKDGVNYDFIFKYIFFLSLILLFDVRVFYIYMIGNSVYLALLIVTGKKKIELFRKILIINFLSIFFTTLLNAFWILPFILSPIDTTETTGTGYSSIESLKFFSFAQLPNSISLLQPNWPENIFGKVGFQKALFLIIPLFAFSSLMFAKRNKLIPVFSLIGLVGIFLAKGSNEPFGEIYIFLYKHIPGFFMFRDPTKFYILISLSFAVLIPLSLSFAKNKRFKLFLSLTFIIFWGFLINEALTGKIHGSFSKVDVPNEYVDFKNNRISDQSFSRTLWIPMLYKFTFLSTNHPTVEAVSFFNATSSAEIIEKLENPKTEELLRRHSIGYVAIPYDSMGTMFLDDRKYSNKVRENLELEVDRISYLNKVNDGNLTIYKTNFKTSLLWMNGKPIPSVSRSSGEVYIKDEYIEEGKLFLSQNYNEKLRLFMDEKEILPNRTYDGLTEYRIRNVKGDAKIFFTDQSNYNLGWAITIIAYASLLIVIFYKPFLYYFKLK